MAKWTEKEIEQLKYWYPRVSARKAAEHVGRSFYATRQKAKDLGIGSRLHNPQQITEWVDAYIEIYDHACALYEKGVPIEIRDRWLDVRTNQKRQQFAVFRIYPRRIESYWEEYG